jgi:hypothetical protein
MSRLRSNTNSHALSTALAVVLLLSAIPLTTGVVIVGSSSHPEFTINICQPTQLLGQASSSVLARPSVNAPSFVLFHQGWLKATPSEGIVERNAAPETPPPKPLI